MESSKFEVKETFYNSRNFIDTTIRYEILIAISILWGVLNQLYVLPPLVAIREQLNEYL
jgi:hypothetical protein